MFHKEDNGMIEVFDKLRSLQDVLSEKYELQSEIEEAPKQLSSQGELLARLKKIDDDNQMLGLRAFVWNVEQCI